MRQHPAGNRVAWALWRPDLVPDAIGSEDGERTAARAHVDKGRAVIRLQPFALADHHREVQAQRPAVRLRPRVVGDIAAW